MNAKCFALALSVAALGSACGSPKPDSPKTANDSKGALSLPTQLVVGAPLAFAKRIGALSAGDAARSAAFTNDGDVVVVGSFEDKVDFGGVMLTSRGGTDVFVARFGADGSLRWVRRFGGSKNDLGQSVAVAPDGSIVVAGSFMTTADFGKKELTTSGNDGNADMFVSKLAPTGTPEWTRALGNEASDSAFSVAADANGIAMVGVLAKGAGALPSPGGAKDTDAIVALYSNSGDRTWFKTFGNVGSDLSGAVAFDRAGNLLVVSDFAVPVPAAGGIPAIGPHALTVTKLRRDGQPAWEKAIGCESMVMPEAVAIGDGDRVFFGGTLYAKGTWGTTTLDVPGSAIGVIASVTTDGAASWIVPIVGSEGASLTALAATTGGGVIAGGHREGTLAVGRERSLEAAQARALFTVTVDAAGKVTGLGSLAAPSQSDRIAHIAADSNGHFALVGTVESELRFDVSAQPLAARGRADGFIAVFGR